MHVGQHVEAAGGVSHFVVVPRHDLEEVAIEFDASAGVIDRRTRVTDEVVRYMEINNIRAGSTEFDADVSMEVANNQSIDEEYAPNQ